MRAIQGPSIWSWRSDVRLVARGFGERNPVGSNDTTDGRQSNRCVEIRLVPLTA